MISGTRKHPKATSQQGSRAPWENSGLWAGGLGWLLDPLLICVWGGVSGEASCLRSQLGS